MLNKVVLPALDQFCDNQQYSTIYVVVDPLADKLPLLEWESLLGKEKLVPLTDNQDGLQLISVNAEQIAACGLDHFSHGICAYLLSHEDIPTLCKQLLMLSSLVHGKKQYRLRYYDPRIMMHLLEILSTNQQQQLLGGIDYWLFFDIFKRPQLVKRDPQIKVKLQPLDMSTAQWARILRIQAVNDNALFYHQLTGKVLSSKELELLDYCIDYSAHRGGVDSNDQLTLVEYTLRYGQLFIYSRQLDRLIQQSKTTSQSLADILAQEPNRFWENKKND